MLLQLCNRTKLLSLQDKAMRNKKDDKLATCMMALCCLPRVDCGICLLLVLFLLLLLLLLVPHVVASDCEEAKEMP